MESGAALMDRLRQGGWVPSVEFTDTPKWSFLEKKTDRYQMVICIVRETVPSLSEVKNIQEHFLGPITKISWLTPKRLWVELCVLFPEVPQTEDLSDAFPWFLGKVQVQNIIQFSPTRVRVDSNYAVKLMNQALGSFLERSVEPGKMQVYQRGAFSYYGPLISIFLAWILMPFLITKIFQLLVKR